MLLLRAISRTDGGTHRSVESYDVPLSWGLLRSVSLFFLCLWTLWWCGYPFASCTRLLFFLILCSMLICCWYLSSQALLCFVREIQDGKSSWHPVHLKLLVVDMSTMLIWLWWYKSSNGQRQWQWASKIESASHGSLVCQPARRTKCHGAKKSSSKCRSNWNAGRCVKTGEEELVDVHEPLDCVLEISSDFIGKMWQRQPTHDGIHAPPKNWRRKDICFEFKSISNRCIDTTHTPCIRIIQTQCSKYWAVGLFHN